MIHNIISNMFNVFEIDYFKHYQENISIYWSRSDYYLINSKEFIDSLIKNNNFFEILLMLNLVNILGNIEIFFKNINSIEKMELIQKVIDENLEDLPNIKKRIFNNMKKYKFEFDLITTLFEDYEFKY